MEQNLGCYGFSSSAGSSKIKIRTSSPYEANWDLYGDEVQILIFDDPAELEKPQRPGSPRARDAWFFPPSKIYEIPLAQRAGTIRQFSSSQLNSRVIHEIADWPTRMPNLEIWAFVANTLI